MRQQIRYAEGGEGRNRYDHMTNMTAAQYGQGMLDRNNDGYDDRDYDRDGRWDDDQARYGQSERMDRNNDGYDDRDYDRDGRWDDDYQNGAYQQPAQRGGIGGLIDSMLGTGGLQVGQRASNTFTGFPTDTRANIATATAPIFAPMGETSTRSTPAPDGSPYLSDGILITLHR